MPSNKSVVDDAREDIRSWWHEDGVIDTVVKIIETVLAAGLIARSSFHTFGYLLENPMETPQDAPEFTIHLSWFAVQEDVKFTTELMCRIFAASYGWFLIQTAFPLRLGVSASIEPYLTGIFLANLLVLAIDPVLLASRYWRT